MPKKAIPPFKQRPEVAAARKGAGLTLEALGKLAGTTAQQIERLEKGQRKFTQEWAERIAPHVNKTAAQLQFPENTVPLSSQKIDNSPPQHLTNLTLTQPQRVGKGALPIEVDGDPQHGPLGPPTATRQFNAPPYSEKRIPVLGTALGGEKGCFILNGQVINYVQCPPWLENVPNAFAFYVVGDSMWPRYFDGELAYVDPNKPPHKDDFVLVELHGDEDGAPGEGYIKWFKGIAGNKIRLEQFNPSKTFTLDMAKVKKISVIPVPGRS